jgi:hypothetical protein
MLDRYGTRATTCRRPAALREAGEDGAELAEEVVERAARLEHVGLLGGGLLARLDRDAGDRLQRLVVLGQEGVVELPAGPVQLGLRLGLPPLLQDVVRPLPAGAGAGQAREQHGRAVPGDARLGRRLGAAQEGRHARRLGRADAVGGLVGLDRVGQGQEGRAGRRPGRADVAADEVREADRAAAGGAEAQGGQGQVAHVLEGVRPELGVRHLLDGPGERLRGGHVVGPLSPDFGQDGRGGS